MLALGFHVIVKAQAMLILEQERAVEDESVSDAIAFLLREVGGAF